MGHETFIALNGAIEIRRSGADRPEIGRPGGDGCHVRDYLIERILQLYNIISMQYPKEISAMVESVRERLRNVRVSTESTAGGSWWVDFRAERHVAVEWRPGRGFGLTSNPEPVAFEGPNEIYTNPELAARRVVQLLRSTQSRLTELREFVGLTQVQLARRLRKGQSAVSQIEKGRDSKVETLKAFIEALGGSLELNVRFKGCDIGIELPLRGNAPKAPARRKRPAVAVR